MDIRTASDLLKEEDENSGGISTMCQGLNGALDGGIHMGQITEFVGEAGIGKTQFCFQLCVTVQLPVRCGGADGEAVYIDCEGTFSTKRLCQVAENSLKETVSKVSFDPLLSLRLSLVSPDSILSGISCLRCHDHIELSSAVFQLQQLITSKPQIKLVIIDGLAFHFRQDFESSAQRNAALVRIMQELCKIATRKNVAIVLTNQVTTRFLSPGSGYTAAALGETFAHFCTNRIFLTWSESGCRFAHLVKSSCCSDTVVCYSVSAEGIRDGKTESEVESDRSGRLFSSDSSQSQ